MKKHIKFIIFLSVVFTIFSMTIAFAIDSENVEFIGHIGGPTYAVCVQGNYSYIGEGCSLRILDISNPNLPVPIGSIVLPSNAIQGIAVVGDYAYVADYTSGLRILDVSNPANPLEIGSYDTTWDAYGVFIKDTYAYIASGASGLRILDISNPATPVEVGYVDSPGLALGVFVQGNYAYLSDYTSGLRIIDVSSTSIPVEVGFYNTPGVAYDVYVQGQYAYIADSYYGLQIIDVTTASTPVEVGSFETLGYAQSVVVHGNYAYVADDTAGLRIIDVSDVSAPVEVGFYDTPGNADDVYVSGDYAYVADRLRNLRVIKISNPTTPVETGVYEVTSYPYKVAASGNYIYVADRYKGLRIIDTSEPKVPHEIGFCEINDYVNDIFIASNYAYIAGNTTGLQIIDISNPIIPREISVFDTPGFAHGVFVSGSYAYVADWHKGLRIIDVSNPATPVEIGSYSTNSISLYDVFVQGHYAYATDYLYSKLRIIDISSPSSPQEVGRYSVSYPQEIMADRESAYVASNQLEYGYGSLVIIDIRDPTAPYRVGYYYTKVNGVDVNENYVYLADGGLQLIDINNPTTPTKVAYYDTPGTAYGVVVNGDYVYISDVSCGLYILHPALLVSNIPDVKLLKGLPEPDVLYLNDYLKIDTTANWSWTSKTKFVQLHIHSDSWADYLEPLFSSAGEDTIRFIASWFGENESVLKYSTYLLHRLPDVLIKTGEQLENCRIDLNEYIHTLASSPPIYLPTTKYTSSSDDGKLFITLIGSTIEISPRGLNEIGSYDASGYGIFVQGNYVYMVDGGTRLHIIDISNPAVPVEVGSYTELLQSQSIYVRDNYAYIADWTNGLQIIDINSASAPAKVGSYNTSIWAYVWVYVRGNYAYLANRLWGLDIIDISNPTAPVKVGAYDTPGDGIAVYVTDTYAFVADGYSGLRIIDISNPAAPFEVGSCPTQSYARNVYVSGNYAYVANMAMGMQQGIQIVDISIPSAPVTVGFYATPGNAYNVTVRNNFAYVSDDNYGLRVIDITNPSNLYETCFYDTPGNTFDACINGNYVYIADGGAGLRILSINSATGSLFAPVELTITTMSDTTGIDWDKEIIHIFEVINTYSEFGFSSDTSRYWYELPLLGVTRLPTFSWVSSINGHDGVLAMTFSNASEGVKLVYNQELDVKPYTWYRLQCSFTSDGDIGNQHQVRGTLFAIATETGTVEFGGFARALGQLEAGNWYTQDAYVYTNGTKLRPMLVFKNNGTPGTIYLDYIRVYECPPMTERAYGALAKIPLANGNFDAGLTGWFYELPLIGVNPMTPLPEYSVVSAFSGQNNVLRLSFSQVSQGIKLTSDPVVDINPMHCMKLSWKAYAALENPSRNIQGRILCINPVIPGALADSLGPSGINSNIPTGQWLTYTAVGTPMLDTETQARVQIVVRNGNLANDTVYLDNITLEQENDSPYYWDHSLF